MRSAFLGIDCGTQSTKAVLVDPETGEELAMGRAEHDLIARSDGTREQHPHWWTGAAAEAVREVMSRAVGIEVRGIGVSGQQHGLVALDAAGEPVRASKLWNDTSTADVCVSLTERMGGDEAVHAATGNVFLPAYTAPKIEWLRCDEPASYGRAVRFCLPHDFLNLWLTGEYSTEPGDASGTAYVDVRRRVYSPEVLAALDEDRDWTTSLPPICDSNHVVGTLRPAIAQLLGLQPGIAVSTGGGDNMCAAIGVGAVEPGAVVMSLGTSGTIFGPSAVPAVDPIREVSAFCSSTGGWLPLACVLNCTLPIEWVQRLLGYDRPRFEAAVASTLPGASGLRFTPYLDGERTPNLPMAAGGLMGLRSIHGPEHMCRAVLEGVTAGLAHAVHAYERTGTIARTVALVGGGARSSVWGQLLADWLDLRIERPAVAEAAAQGAALQAAHVLGGAPLRTGVPIDAVWEPAAGTGMGEAVRAYAELLGH